MYHKVTLTLLALTIMLSSATFPLKATVTTTVYVDPPTTTVKIDQTLMINISIAYVTDLYAWQLKLYYKNILNGTGIVEGPFLKTGGYTFFYPIEFNDAYNATHGRLRAACTLTGNVSGVDGSGVLATITFKTKAGGDTVLDLTETELADSKISPIPHTAIDGIVHVGVHEIAITSVAPSKTIVGQGFNLYINVTVANEGNYTETFNVTAYANTTVIQTFVGITLTNGSFRTVTFTWSTASFALGVYTINATATPVPGETEITDNTRIAHAQIATPGDINGDGHVNLVDLSLLADHWFSIPHYDPNADINSDSFINLSDLSILADHWFKGPLD